MDLAGVISTGGILHTDPSRVLAAQKERHGPHHVNTAQVTIFDSKSADFRHPTSR